MDNELAGISGLSETDVVASADAILALADAFALPLVVLYKALDTAIIASGAAFPMRVTGSGVAAAFDTATINETVLPGEPIAFTPSIRVTPFLAAEMNDEGRGALANLQRLADTLHEADAVQLQRLDQKLVAALALSGDRPTPDKPSRGRTSSGRDGHSADFLTAACAMLSAPEYDLRLTVGAQETSRVLLYYRAADAEGRLCTWLHAPEQEALLGVMAHASPTVAPEALLAEPESGPVSEALDYGLCRWFSWSQWREGHGLEPAQTRADGCAVAVPIHVGGLPWLALVVSFPSQEGGRLRRARTFYRDLLTELSSMLRRGAEGAYLRALQQRLDDLLQANAVERSQVQSALDHLAATFPYPRLRALDAADEEGWPGGLRLEQEPNDVLGRGSRGVDYQVIPIAEIRDRYFLAAAAEDRRRLRSYQDKLSSYVALGHTLKNVVFITGYRGTQDKIAGIRRNLRELARRGHPIDDAHVVEALDAAASTLSLFSTVEGLGHFIRLAGADSGTFAWSKFADWAPSPGSPEVPTEAILRGYRDSLWPLVQTICFGCEWNEFVLETPDLGPPLSWDGREPPPLQVSKLSFPPFRAGCDVGYLYLFCLAEPLINAVRALGSTNCRGVDTVPLRIRITMSDTTASAVVVEVINLSRSPINHPLSGWESTKRLLSDLGMGRYDLKPRSPQRSDGLYEVTVGVTFDPQPFLDRLPAEARHA